MKHLFAPAALFLLASCSSAQQAAVNNAIAVDGPKALYFLEAAGCVTNAAAAAASPIIQAQADAQGNAVLTMVGSAAGQLCKVSVPAAAVAPVAH